LEGAEKSAPFCFWELFAIIKIKRGGEMVCTIKAGETAPQTGYYVCKKCGYKIMVQEGKPVPVCPACSHDILVYESE